MSISVSDELAYEALDPEIKELCERIFADLKQEAEDAYSEGYKRALRLAIDAINNL